MEDVYQRVIEAAGGVPYRLSHGEDFPRSARYEAMGAGVAQLIGVPPGEFTFATLQEITRHAFVLEPSVKQGVDAVEVFRRGEAPCYHAELCIVRPDGKLRWLSDSSVPLRDASGGVVGSAGFLQDITERRSTHMAMIRAQRMEALGLLASSVAHDFNNLLVAILGNAELALGHGEMDRATRRRLADIERAAQSASALTHQLLLHGRRREIERREVDLNALLRELMRMLRRLITERIHLVFRPSPRRLLLWADRSLIEQAMLNLCINARDEMPAGGRLTISTGSADGHALIRVRDTGGGIPAEVREVIFDPFFTTKGEGQGTGLGLASVRTVAEQHGGTAEIEESSPEGTTFILRLPLLSAVRGASAGDADGGEREASLPTLCVLLAEDEPVVRLRAQRTLETAGHRVILARDGLEAIEAFESNRGCIDVALLDIVMPHVNGDRVARILRDARPELPIILSSGYNPEETLTQLSLDRAWAFLPKPYHPSDLRRALHGVFAHAPSAP